MKRSRKCTPYLLLAPMLLVMAVFVYGLASAIVQSLGFIPSLGLHSFTLSYYLEIARDRALLSSWGTSLYLSGASALLSLVLGVAVSAALVKMGRFAPRLLPVVQLPILIPHTLVALFTISILSQNGLLARAAHALGIIGDQSAFPPLLFNQNGAGVIFAYVWKEAPFVAYYVFALMQSINGAYGEAASTLGAGPFKSFFTVLLPLSMPAILNAFIIVFAYSFGAYELPFLLGATLPKALPVEAYLAYLHPDLRQRPLAMAINGIVILITFVLALVYYTRLQTRAEGAGNAQIEKK